MATRATTRRRRRAPKTQTTTQTAKQNGFGVADIATGAIVGVAGAASNPISTLRRQARQLRRRGEPVNKEIAREAYTTGESAARTSSDVASGRLSERVALEGVRLMKRQARRDDLVGDIAFTTLSAINSAVKRMVGTLTKFETDSEPPERGTRRRATTTSRTRRTRATGSSTATRRRRSTGSTRTAATGTTRKRRSSGSARRRTSAGATAQAESKGTTSTRTRRTRTGSTSRKTGTRSTQTRRSAPRQRRERTRQERAAETQVAGISAMDVAASPQPELMATPELVGAVETTGTTGA